ncbi:unnamed protein product [Malus fusca]
MFAWLFQRFQPQPQPPYSPGTQQSGQSQPPPPQHTGQSQPPPAYPYAGHNQQPPYPIWGFAEMLAGVGSDMGLSRMLASNIGPQGREGYVPQIGFLVGFCSDGDSIYWSSGSSWIHTNP